MVMHSKLISYINTPAVSISNLSSVSKWLPTVSAWHHHEWLQREKGDIGAVEQFEAAKLREQRLQAHLSESCLPVTFIAHNTVIPIGSVSLVEYQFQKSIEPSIWLTNLYVEPQYRNQGVASQLLDTVTRYAQDNAIEALSLYTHDQAQFYQSRGWQSVAQHTLQGEHCDIMKFKFP